MELKRYQKEVLNKFELFLKEEKVIQDKTRSASIAYMSMTELSYKKLPDELSNRPFICVKVPTGGGKTFIASHIVGSAYKHFQTLQQKNDTGLVLWLVPSDAIRTQTLEKLRDGSDPVREELDGRFNNKVVVMDILEARSIKKSDISENVAIVVATFASFKRENTEGLKVFQNNGALMTHFENEKGNEDHVYSVVEVIKKNTPLVILDEGHNAQTDLSLDMFKDLNPCMIVEFTATPRDKSNILVTIPATELRLENMIKMPIRLETQTLWQDALKLAFDKRKELEKIAKKQKDDSYIRPILLIQAEQEKESANKVHVAIVVEYLENELGIGRKEIAIRTGKQNEIQNVNLKSVDCQIRYIITVDALKEGWDCSFAYVLASIKNLGAHVAVKQLIGRILRLPYAREHEFPELNQAYIYASAPNFQDTAKLVIEGLKNNGYEVDDGEVLSSKTVDIVKTKYARKVKGKAELPLVAFNSGGIYHELDYSADLIGDFPVLKNVDPQMTLDEKEDTGVTIIDLNKTGDLVREEVKSKYYAGVDLDFSKEQLVEWLLKKISRSYFSITDIQEFTLRVVNKLVPKMISINHANRKRYLILEKINQSIDVIVDAYTHKQFLKLSQDKKILMNPGVVCMFGDAIEYSKVLSHVIYDKHLFVGVGDMNNEEQKLAGVINNTNSVEWWLRNPEQEGFYIQGWLSDKFRPDFIVKTKKGDYFILEYKGDQLVTNDDSKYKKEIGETWAKLSGERYHFEMIEKGNISSIADKILRY